MSHKKGMLPWLRRVAWDAFVLDESGAPDENARAMVNSWIKRRLIGDFFELLSTDGFGDKRRLDYWLRFEPFIDDMWFALGPDAMRKTGDAFDDFRKRAKGRCLALHHSASENNAFLMRIGPWLAVEFGVKGHAFFLVHWESLPQRLSHSLQSADDRSSVSLHALKFADAEKRLIHRDSLTAGLRWEEKFDDVICPLLAVDPERSSPPTSGQQTKRMGIAGSSVPSRLRAAIDLSVSLYPKGAQSGEGERAKTVGKDVVFGQKGRYEIPAFIPPWSPEEKADLPRTSGFSETEFDRFVTVKKLTVVDNRGRDGALWVSERGAPSDVGPQLMAWGFRLKPGKGWWKE